MWELLDGSSRLSHKGSPIKRQIKGRERDTGCLRDFQKANRGNKGGINSHMESPTTVDRLSIESGSVLTSAGVEQCHWGLLPLWRRLNSLSEKQGY